MNKRNWLTGGVICVVFLVGVHRVMSQATWSTQYQNWKNSLTSGLYQASSDIDHDSLITLKDFELLRQATFDVLPSSTPSSTPPTPTPTVVSSTKPYIQDRAFYISGRPFVFTGVNVSGLAHYGKNDILPYTSSNQIDAALDEMSAMGMRVVRVFVANNQITDTEAANRLFALLEKAKSKNMYVVASLIDYYHSGFSPSACDGQYIQSGNFNILSDAFFHEQYTSCFIPFVSTVVERNANHSQLFAWELGNEIRSQSSFSDFSNFAKTTINRIRLLDHTTLITTGDMPLSAPFSDSRVTELYQPGVYIDYVSSRAYDFGDLAAANGGQGDWAYNFTRLGSMPLVVEEGAFQGGDRVNKLSSALTSIIGQGQASGYLWWGFMPFTTDNGNGDTQFGFDRVWHSSDYDGLKNSFATFNTTH